jgi:hypothetical protein
MCVPRTGRGFIVLQRNVALVDIAGDKTTSELFAPDPPN